MKKFFLALVAVIALLGLVAGTASAADSPGLAGCKSVSTMNTSPTVTTWTDGRSSPKEQEAFIIWATSGGQLPAGFWGGTLSWRATYTVYNSSTGSFTNVPLSEDCASVYAYRRPSDGVIFKTTIRTRLRVVDSAGNVSQGDTRYRRVCAYPNGTPIDSHGLPTGSNCLLLTSYNVG